MAPRLRPRGPAGAAPPRRRACGAAVLALVGGGGVSWLGCSTAACRPLWRPSAARPGLGGGAEVAVKERGVTPRARTRTALRQGADASVSEDVGYDLLFETASEEFSERCVAASKPFPAYATGDFVMPSIGQFEMGDRKFVGFLDCYGKMHRFDIRGDKVCATYRMMESGFYNESRQAGTIGAGLLFFETEPPRETPWYLGPVANMPPFAPNDNTYVNTIRLGDEILSLTDSYAMLVVDPKTMRVLKEKEFKDDLKGLVCYTGSAHPLRDAKTGDWIDFVGNVKNMLTGDTTLRLFRLGEQQPDFRRSIADLDFETAPYMHSFGLTENYVVLPRMPVKFSATDVATKPMADAFQELDLTEEGPENGFHIVPLDGSKAWVRQLPTDQPLWYVHTVNAFEREGAIVIDLTTCPKNPFAADLTLAASRDKGTRDLGAVGGKNLVKRFVIPLNDDQPVRSEVISDPDTSTDFPCVNPGFRAKEHCFYWAVEWFATSNAYADMAIVKHDICGGGGGKKLAWRRENWYPSEATMVPSDRVGAAEDEGVLIFTALEGATGNSYLLGVDAQTMELVSEAGPFPRIPFTTHGQFYPAEA